MARRGRLISARLIKIATLDWFLHSNKAAFIFDYSKELDGGSKSWLHDDELGRLNRGISTDDSKSLLPKTRPPRTNTSHITAKHASDFTIPVPAATRVAGTPPLQIRLTEALDDPIVTGFGLEEALVQDGRILTDPDRDILKIAVVNRYADTPRAITFVRAVGLKSGAIASNVAHDCHDLVGIGTTDEDLAGIATSSSRAKEASLSSAPMESKTFSRSPAPAS